MILGISITEDMVYVKSDIESEVISIPFVILRITENNTWHIGGKAYEMSILNKGIIVDKILYMIENNSYITISNQKYLAQQLLDYFFKELLIRYEAPEFVTVSVYKNDVKILKSITHSFELILGENKLHVTSNSEAMINYVINSVDDINFSTIGLIDFTNKSLNYYELNLKRTKSNKYVFIVNKTTHPPISKDMFKDKTGDLVLDNLLTEFIKNVSKNKSYQMMLLSGVGLENYTMYIDFINTIIKISPKVVQEVKVFALGALYISKKIVENINDDNYYITDMRTSYVIKLKVNNSDYEYKNICNIGEEWFYKNDFFNIIVDNEDELIFKIEDYNKNKKDDKIFKLDNQLVSRKDKTNMLSLHVYFTQQNIFQIDIKDIGFGDFYEKTNNNSSLEVIL